MRNRQIYFRILSYATTAFLAAGLSGCGMEASTNLPSPSATASSAKSDTSLSIQTEVPTSTLAPLPTSTAAPTATQTWIPTTTPALADPFAPPLPEFALGRLGKGGIAAMDLSPNERNLAVASNIGIYLYRTDMDTGAMKQVWFQPTTRAAVSVAFSPDGRLLAAGLQGMTETEYFCDPHLGSGGILVLDAASGNLIHYLNRSYMGSPQDLSFSPDGSEILYIDHHDVDDSAYAWTLGNPEPEAIADPDGEGWEGVWNLTVSSDGKWLALEVQLDQSGNFETQIRILETATGRIVYRLKAGGSAWAMDFSRNGRKFAVADSEKNLKIWDLSTGEETASAVIPDVRQLRFAADNRRIFVRTTAGIRLWDSAEDQTVWSLADPSRGISVSYDGLRLFSYDAEALTIRNTGDGTATGDYLLGHESVYTPAYSADGKELLAETNWGTIKVWEATTRRVLRSIRVSGTWSGFVLAADNRTMAVNRGKSLEIWDYQQGKPIRTVAMPDTGVCEFAVSPDGGKLAAISGEKIYLYDSLSGEILMQQPSGGGVAISPDGRLLAFSSADSAKIILWDIQKAAVSSTLNYGWEYGTGNFDFSPDSLHLGTAGYGPRVMWWSITDPVPQPNTGIDFYWPVLDLAFSPDGKTGAAASYDIRIWELSSGRPVLTMTGHACYPTEVVYSPDGAVLASGSADGTVLLWDMAAAVKNQ